MTDNEEDEKTTPSPEASSTDDDSLKSIFSELIDKIDDRKLSTDSEESTSEAVDTTRQESIENENTSPNRVRGQLLNAVSSTSDNSTDSNATGNKLFFGGIILGVVVAVVFPSVVSFTVGHVTDTLFAPPPAEYVDENETLHMSAEDASYMNRVFRETTHEVGYCGLITTDQPPTFTVWMANTENSSAEHLSVLTDNCPEENREILIHTHPNGDLRLSEKDKRTLERRSERFICIQGGQITTEPGAAVEQLVCYRQANSGDSSSEPTRIPVALIADSS